MELSAKSIWLATAAVDMRTGINGLSLHVQQALGRLPCDGTAYVFANRRRTRLKMVCWDGTGVWMVSVKAGPSLRGLSLPVGADRKLTHL